MADDPELQDALDNGDFDGARLILETRPWQRSAAFLRAVDLVVDVFLTVEPQFAASLLRRRAEHTMDTAERLRVQISEIDALCRSDQLDEADRVFDQMQSHLADVSDAVDRHTMLSNIATFFQRAGAPSIARPILNNIVAANRDLDPDVCSSDQARLMAAVLLNLATVEAHPTAGNLDEALNLLDEAQSFAQTNHATLGNIAYNRGFVHVQRGEIAHASNAYGEAASFFRLADGDPADLAYVLRGRAGLLGRVGRIDEAAELYEEAVDSFLEAGAFDEAARTDIGLIMAQAMAGQTIAAERIAESRARLEQASPTDLPELLMNVGNVEASQSSTESAYKTFTSCRRRFRSAGRRIDVARADLSRAVMLRRLGRIHHALRVAQGARRIFEEGGRDQLIAHADNNLALILDALGRPDEAIDAIMRALSELDRHRHRLPTAHDRLTVGTVTYPNLFNLAFRLTNRQPDLQASLIERARIQPSPDSADPTANTLAPPPPVAARPYTTVVPGHGSVRYLHNPSGGTNPTHRLSWAFTDDWLLRCHLTAEQTHVDRVPVDAGLLHELELALARPTPDDLEHAMDLPTAQRVALFRAATGPLLDDPALADRIAPTLLHGDRQRISALERCSAEALLGGLGRLLLPPTIRHVLAQEINPTIVVAPPPQLGRVPWASLIVNDQCLVQTAAIQADLPVALRSHDKDRPEAQPGGDAVWVGDPTGDLRFCRRTPVDHWHVLTSTSEPPATRDAVLASLRTNPDVFVYRGHITPGPATDPAAAHLVLANSTMLRADDLGEQHRGPAVCFLLGCDSSGGTSGMEWTGVATGFIWAGARDVVTTQWEVIDRPAQDTLDADLIRSCLRHGVTDGLGRWQRTHADAWQKQSASAAGPYSWANPIVVTSRPRTLSVNDDRLEVGDKELHRLAIAVR